MIFWHPTNEGPLSGRRLYAKIAVLATLLLAVSVALRAQTGAAGASRLDAIEVTGSARFHSEQIVPAAGLRLGANVARDDLQSGADRLAKLGLFAGVQYRFTTAEGGVKVTYQVMDLPTLPVSFDNFPWFSDEEITAALKNNVALFDGSAPAQGTILDELSAALEKLIETRRVRATVTHALATSSNGQPMQQFRAEGTEMKVGSVEFSDAVANSDRGIQTRVSDIVGKPFSRGALETFEVEQVRPIYLAKGYLRVRFDRPTARFAGGTNSDLPNKIVVVAPIEPGAAYVWNGITWTGNSALQPQELDQFPKLKPGDTADGMKIEAMWQEVRDAYSKRGFLDVSLIPTAQFDEDSKRVRYSVSIKEGPQYQMGSLILSGLSPDGEKRIRTAWKIPSGTVFDKTFYDQFLDGGIKQAFTGLSYHYNMIGKFLQQDPKTGKVDVLLDFQ